MEWKDLSREAANVLERCWSIHHDRPLSFTVEIGKPFGSGKEVTVPTESTYKDILKYQKTNPQFDLIREEQRLTVKGNCDYGSWF